MVIESHTQELGANALHAVAAVAGDPMRRLLDVHRRSDGEMPHVARSHVFVVIGTPLRFDMANKIQLGLAPPSADGSVTQARPLRDPHARPALPTKSFDLDDLRFVRAVWQALRTGTVILQPIHSAVPIAHDPLSRTLPAFPQLALLKAIDHKRLVEHDDGGSPCNFFQYHLFRNSFLPVLGRKGITC